VNVPAVGITGLVYRSVQSSTRLLGSGVDAVLAAAARLLADGERSVRQEALVAILNGIYGDYLDRTANPLATRMSLRFKGQGIDARDPAGSLCLAAAPPPGAKVVLLVHGLCMNDLGWSRNGHDHGLALFRDLGSSPLYLRYNSGLRIHENGRLLSELLERLVERWPVPIEALDIVGHSMGGLVARSACHHAARTGSRWLSALGKLVFLGTPHLGSPLERGGESLDFILDLSPYSSPIARIGRQRSAGIQDLRHGRVAEYGVGVPLPHGVRSYAAAATLASRRSLLADRLIGDGLVPLDSALGRHRDRDRALGIPKARQWIGYRMGHLDLLSRNDVYAQLRHWLTA
jgi:pimeloyl-ACP methyl ester carboxylesterase